MFDAPDHRPSRSLRWSAAAVLLALASPGPLQADLPPLPIPEPVVTSFAFVEHPGPDGRFLVEAHVRARHHLDPMAFGVVASDGVSLDATGPLFMGSLEAGATRTFRVAGRWDRQVPGATVSLALEYRYPEAAVREEVRRRRLGAGDPSLARRLEARIEALASRVGHRLKALPLGAAPPERGNPR